MHDHGARSSIREISSAIDCRHPSGVYGARARCGPSSR